MAISVLWESVLKALNSRYTPFFILLSSAQPDISLEKATRLVQHDLPLVNLHWLFPIIFLSFREDSGEAEQTWVSQILLPKDWSNFYLLPILWNHPWSLLSLEDDGEALYSDMGQVPWTCVSPAGVSSPIAYILLCG